LNNTRLVQSDHCHAVMSIV